MTNVTKFPKPYNGPHKMPDAGDAFLEGWAVAVTDICRTHGAYIVAPIVRRLSFTYEDFAEAGICPDDLSILRTIYAYIEGRYDQAK